MAEDGTPSSNGMNDDNESNNENSDLPQQLHLDLGDDLSRKLNTSNSNESQRREDNPFSFKHFLRSDSTNYQNKGARPKVYCENRSASVGSDLNDHLTTTNEVKQQQQQQQRILPEYSSALPDFVQDHLVIEQCYLGNNNPTNNYNFDVNNLPDFTINRDSNVCDYIKDYVNRPNFNVNRENQNNDIPLDLPLRPPQADFPLDLPIVNTTNGNRNTTAEVGNSKSLPDFLADSGAVCTQKNDSQSSIRTPESEIERLRNELDNTRQQLNEQQRRCEVLTMELDLARSKEHDYTQNLAKALEQVESNLEKSRKRANSAENTVVKLKNEISSLRAEINHLKFENKSLKGEEAAGGPSYYNPSNELQSQRLAQELRAAASTAEHSLRQLLTGVDNLRIMAASLENMHRIEEEKNDLFLDNDKDTGPAL